MPKTDHATTQKPDLITCPPSEIADVLRAATQLGVDDELASKPPVKSGAELAKRLTKGWRKGHERFLMSAYRAGRWAVETMGKPTR